MAGLDPQGQAPQAEYERRRAESREAEQRLDTWSAAFGNGRVVLVLIAGGAALLAYNRGDGQPITFLIVMAALMLGTLVGQTIVDGRKRVARLRIALYDRCLDRLGHRWNQFPSKGERFRDPGHPYATDLDLLGDGSLFQLLDTSHTAQGEQTLANWLLTPASRSEILARQETTRALAFDVDGREAVALAGADEELSRINEEPLTAWAEGPLLLTLSPAVVWLARILPFVTVGTYFLVRDSRLPWWTLVILALAHLGLLRSVREGVAALGPIAEHAERMLSRLIPLIEASKTFHSVPPRMQALLERLKGAQESIASLKRRVTMFQSRGNMFIAVISPIVFWDIHSSIILQTWQRRTKTQLRQWFEAIGELEAFCSFATYAYEHPADVWPEISEKAVVFDGKELGHPLLSPQQCVRNDLALNGAGTAILITGSNMSGKSTMLRAVGLNAVLALAGLPVRATSLTLSIIQVATVMRVSDSLQEGASFFLAEVKRLKRVVDLSHGELPLLFLLDEILQGTNTRERSLGAKGVIAHLLRDGAFGLVSTHDLSLVQLGDAFGDRLRYAHFTDQVQGKEMTFDYRLKPGVVQTSNALRLMRAVGLEVETD